MLRTAAPGSETGVVVHILARNTVHDELRVLRDGDAGVGERGLGVGAVMEKRTPLERIEDRVHV